MSGDRPLVAAPILFWGIASGMVASLVCCFWPVSAAGAFFAARGVRRDHDVSAGGSLGIGLATGLVAGLLVATFGTAIVVAGSSPDQAEMFEALGLEGAAPDLGAVALMYAFFGLAVSGALGMIGGAVAGSGPAKSRASVPAPAPRATVAPTPVPEAAPTPEAAPVAEPSGGELPSLPELDVTDERDAWGDADGPTEDVAPATLDEEEGEGVDTV